MQDAETQNMSETQRLISAGYYRVLYRATTCTYGHKAQA